MSRNWFNTHMVFSRWRNWVYIILWIHIGSLIANGVVYGIIAFTKNVPFLDIFQYPESAPYYLTVYVFVLIFCLSLCALGLVFGDIFGHKDLRAQMVSRGMLVAGLLASFLPISLITMWNIALDHSVHNWMELAMAVQHLGVWIAFVSIVIYASLMVLIFYLGRENASISKGWTALSLGLGCFGFVIALSCIWIVDMVIVFRLVYLAGGMLYLVWAIWLASFIKRVERMP